MSKKLPYLFWFLFYIILLGVPTFGLIIPLYIIAFIVALNPIAESLWRTVCGVRPLRLKQEKERLLPLFEEIYRKAVKINPYISKGIDIYIQENMSINAFAFGKSTLVLTKGSIDLLNDDCLKGLIAHELGHFANYDTAIVLFANIGNFPITILMKSLEGAKTKLEEASKNSFVMDLFKTLFNAVYFFFWFVQSVGDLLIMHTRRQSEYTADINAYKFGYGAQLAEVLSEIYQVSFSDYKSVKELFKSTHPPITKRIEKLEIYNEH